MNLEQALPAEVALSDVDRPTILEHIMDRYGHLAPATYNRNLATISSLFTWCVENDLLPVSPTSGIRPRKQRTTVEAKRQSRPIDVDELAALWSGGSAERIYWTSTTARLLPRLINGRTHGPLFVGERKPRSHLAPAAEDLCEVTGRARLSYRWAEEIWKRASGGRTLAPAPPLQAHPPSRSRQDVTMIKAKSRHRSLRSLERYVNPSPDSIRDLTNRHYPNRRGLR